MPQEMADLAAIREELTTIGIALSLIAINQIDGADAPSSPSTAANRAFVPLQPVRPGQRRSRHEHRCLTEIAQLPRAHHARGTLPRKRSHRTATTTYRNRQRETCKSHPAARDTCRRRSQPFRQARLDLALADGSGPCRPILGRIPDAGTHRT